MYAYHLRTSEPEPIYIFRETFTLDSLLIPETSILIGYAQHSKREGAILSYPCLSIYSKRLQALANGQNSHEGVPVLGDVIGTLRLEDELVKRIRQNYHPPAQKDYYLVTKNIKLGWDFEGSTKELLYILSGGFVKEKGDGGKRKKVKECSPKPSLVLQPAPAFI